MRNETSELLTCLAFDAKDSAVLKAVYLSKSDKCLWPYVERLIYLFAIVCVFVFWNITCVVFGISIMHLYIRKNFQEAFRFPN